MTNLNFKCDKCNASFETEVKKAIFGRNGNLSVEEEIICPTCGTLKNGEYSFPEEINKTAVGELYFEFMKKENMNRDMDKTRKEAIRKYRPGQMFQYEDIFNQEKLLNYEVGDKKYYLLDSYCVMPDCTCEDVTLEFIDKEDQSEIKTPVFMFFLNYKNRNIDHIKGIDEEKVRDIAESFTQETLNTFKERHEKLKDELNEDIIRVLKKYKRKIPEPPKRKIGRNESCPCGSGIKYKKCCLDRINKQTTD